MTEMRMIFAEIDEELENAEDYLERFVSNRADMIWADRFKQMGIDSIHHAQILTDYASKRMNEFKLIYTLENDTLEEWQRLKSIYEEKTRKLSALSLTLKVNSPLES